MASLKERFLPEESFRSLGNYGRALLSTRRRFQERVFARADEEKEVREVAQRSKHAMKKTLNWWDLLWFSIGAVMGAGIFVLTGQEAHGTVGPAIVVSYAVAGISAMLSVFCYTEFAVEIPAAGETLIQPRRADSQGLELPGTSPPGGFKFANRPTRRLQPAWQMLASQVELGAPCCNWNDDDPGPD